MVVWSVLALFDLVCPKMLLLARLTFAYGCMSGSIAQRLKKQASATLDKQSEISTTVANAIHWAHVLFCSTDCAVQIANTEWSTWMFDYARRMPLPVHSWYHVRQVRAGAEGVDAEFPRPLHVRECSRIPRHCQEGCQIPKHQAQPCWHLPNTPWRQMQLFSAEVGEPDQTAYDGPTMCYVQPQGKQIERGVVVH
jgi:hypothetical protein